jgi:hypothetical protein
MRYIKAALPSIGEYLAQGFLYLVGFWIVFALFFQLFFVYLHFSGNDDLGGRISNEIMWKIFGTMKKTISGLNR